MPRTESTFFEHALRSGINLRPGMNLGWLSKRGHLAEALRSNAPEEVIDLLRRMHVVLGGDERVLEAKRCGRDPTPDFFHAELGLLVEVDEVQHFTSDRLRLLDMYPEDAKLAYDVSAYKQFVGKYRPTADRYRAAKPATDFPFEGGRRAQRAYFDSLRDLLAPNFGLKVLRLPAPECDGLVAFRRFEKAVALIN